MKVNTIIVDMSLTANPPRIHLDQWRGDVGEIQPGFYYATGRTGAAHCGEISFTVYQYVHEDCDQNGVVLRGSRWGTGLVWCTKAGSFVANSASEER